MLNLNINISNLLESLFLKKKKQNKNLFITTTEINKKHGTGIFLQGNFSNCHKHHVFGCKNYFDNPTKHWNHELIPPEKNWLNWARAINKKSVF